MNQLTQSKNTTILPALIALTLACFGLSPQARAVCQKGCLAGENTVLGEDALLNNTGSSNTATGSRALVSNTTGNWNTANGYLALESNTTGIYNIAIGVFALNQNRTGDSNTAIGAGALLRNTTGTENAATGDDALGSNTRGNFNTANGVFALYDNRTGNSNIALGFQAGVNITGNSNIDIGNEGMAGESNTLRIGTTGTQTATYIAGISGVTVAGGVGVIVDVNGQLGTIVSSERFKDKIQPMDKTSEAILALKPVTFRYKQELDPEGIPQFGLVAEQVEKVNPDLVARDADGKAYTVRYEAVNAMLLNEFLKEHKKVEALEGIVTSLAATVNEQAAQIQKVSAQLEASIRAQQTVVSNP
jgi:trimeric autotransporter adhesin